MNKYTNMALFAALTLTAIICVSCENENDNDNDSTQPVIEEETFLSKILPIGRTYWDNNTKELWLAHSGTGAAFTFVGRRLDITFVGNQNSASNSNARVAVYVGGVRTADILMDRKERKITVFNVTEEFSTPIDVRIIKLSESQDSVVGIKEIAVTAVSDYGIKPAAEKPRKIEIIGDSITAGYGIDDLGNKQTYKTATEDITKTYAYKTAMAFGADYSIVCHSGIGIISNYGTNNGDKNNPNGVMPIIYDKIGARTNPSGETFPGGVTSLSLTWDFNKFQPDLIVINLGTNDREYIRWSGNAHSTERGNEFVAGYVAFLKDIRTKNPNAKLLCTINLMEANDIWPLVQRAVEDYKTETGESDSNITAFRLPAQNTSWNSSIDANNIGTDWHPLENSNATAAIALVTEIERFMSWVKDADVLEEEETLFAGDMVR